MTLSSLTVKTSYAGDDATTDFATGFGFWNSSDLSVILVSSSGYETTYVEGTNYSVTGGGARRRRRLSPAGESRVGSMPAAASTTR